MLLITTYSTVVMPLIGNKSEIKTFEDKWKLRKVDANNATPGYKSFQL